jgi:hypothetical protein
MNTNDLEASRKRNEFWAKLIGAGVICAIVGPFAVNILYGLLGIGALLLGIGIVTTGMFFMPVVARKFANARLKAIKAEAARNPVETLQNNYRTREIALNKAETSITTFCAKIENFRGKLADFMKKWPQEGPRFQNILSKMEQLYGIRRDKWRKANRDLQSFALEIEKAGAIWEMGQAANDLGEAAGMSEEAFFEAISTQTAINSVTESMNLAFAELDQALLESEDEKNAFSFSAPAQVSNKHTTQALPPPSQPERLFVNVTSEKVSVR